MRVELRSRCHHQVVRGQHRSGGCGDRSGFRVDRYRRRTVHVDGLVMTEDPSQRPGDVICGYLGRGELVQHRLELVVVVAVQQDHVDIILGKMLGAPLDPSPARAGTAVEIGQPSMSGTHHPTRVMPRVGASARLGVS